MMIGIKRLHGLCRTGIGKLARLALGRLPGEADSMTLQSASYPRHRFPAEIISHALRLYHVCSLSLILGTWHPS